MATAGPSTPSSVVDDAATGTVTWTTPGNAAASDNAYAYASGAVATTHYLKATGFGFAIPAGATIKGITVAVERKTNKVQVLRWAADSIVRLVKAGAVAGDNKADTVTHWTLADVTVAYGGSADLWGLPLTAEDINDASFGVAISVYCYDTVVATVAFVDSISVTVEYAEQAPESDFAGWVPEQRPMWMGDVRQDEEIVILRRKTSSRAGV